MSQRTPEEVAAGALHERECPAPIHWEETRRSIISRFASAIARERETAYNAGAKAFSGWGDSNVTAIVADGKGGVKVAPKTGHVLLDDGRVLPMAPRADGSPSTLPVTRDGYVMGLGHRVWQPHFGGPFDGVAFTDESERGPAWDATKKYALQANAAAAAKGGG